MSKVNAAGEGAIAEDIEYLFECLKCKEVYESKPPCRCPECGSIAGRYVKGKSNEYF